MVDRIDPILLKICSGDVDSLKEYLSNHLGFNPNKKKYIKELSGEYTLLDWVLHGRRENYIKIVELLAARGAQMTTKGLESAVTSQNALEIMKFFMHGINWNTIENIPYIISCALQNGFSEILDFIPLEKICANCIASVVNINQDLAMFFLNKLLDGYVFVDGSGETDGNCLDGVPFGSNLWEYLQLLNFSVSNTYAVKLSGELLSGDKNLNEYMRRYGNTTVMVKSKGEKQITSFECWLVSHLLKTHNFDGVRKMITELYLSVNTDQFKEFLKFAAGLAGINSCPEVTKPYYDFIKFLVENGLDLDLKIQDNESALKYHFLLVAEYPDIYKINETFVVLLISLGADVNKLSKETHEKYKELLGRAGLAGS